MPEFKIFGDSRTRQPSKNVPGQPLYNDENMGHSTGHITPNIALKKGAEPKKSFLCNKGKVIQSQPITQAMPSGVYDIDRALIYKDADAESANAVCFEELEFTKPVNYEYDNYTKDWLDYLPLPEPELKQLSLSPPRTPAPNTRLASLEFDCSYKDDFFTSDYMERSLSTSPITPIVLFKKGAEPNNFFLRNKGKALHSTPIIQAVLPLEIFDEALICSDDDSKLNNAMYFEELDFTKPAYYEYDYMDRSLSMSPITPNVTFKKGAEPNIFFLRNKGKTLHSTPITQAMPLLPLEIFDEAQIFSNDEAKLDNTMNFEELEFTKPAYYEYDNYTKDWLDFLPLPEPELQGAPLSPRTPAPLTRRASLDFNCSYQDDFFIDDFENQSILERIDGDHSLSAVYSDII